MDVLMTVAAVDALQADRDALLAVCADLGDEDWSAPSGCEGWTVKDVAGHVGALFWLVVDRAKLPDTADLPTEKAQDVYVDSRRSWTPTQVLEDYESVSARAIEALRGLATQDFELTLGDLGTYPVSLLPNAFAFDHFTHIRADLVAPRGPLQTEPPAFDPQRLEAALDWIEAALPQQNGDLVDRLTGAVELQVEDLAARTIRFGKGEPVAQITSGGLAFVRWVTQRGSWEELDVTASGPDGVLSLVRRFHVF
jgi:uncharacterized protein (TIGR03083 family)